MHKLLEMGDPGELDLLRRRVEDLEQQNEKLLSQLREATRQNEVVDRSVAIIRKQLNPLHQALRGLFGEINSVFGTEESGGMYAGPAASSSGSSVPAPHNRATWDAWKQQLPSTCGRVIDALLVQPLTQTQMKTFCKMDISTISKAMKVLKGNGLVEQDGRLWKLKRI